MKQIRSIEKDPSSAWVNCDGLSVCVATDKIRPCTAAELLAYQFSQGKDLAQPPVIDTTSQQNFIDERILPAEELGAEELRLQAALEPISPTSPSPLAEGDYMADEDFNMMISSSAAASSTTPSAPSPTPKPTVLQRASKQT